MAARKTRSVLIGEGRFCSPSVSCYWLRLTRNAGELPVQADGASERQTPDGLGIESLPPISGLERREEAVERFFEFLV
ncbi:MAG: hypothetical protein II150_11635, partial [Thermoguttaceae bacterium]|nr:hypothetical protein [Thermoguttaceae bacterium]